MVTVEGVGPALGGIVLKELALDRDSRHVMDDHLLGFDAAPCIAEGNVGYNTVLAIPEIVDELLVVPTMDKLRGVLYRFLHEIFNANSTGHIA